MSIKAIAYSYWRRIKDDARSFAAVPATVKDDVRALAQMDVQEGIITAQRYAELIGEPYTDGAGAEEE